jgi:DNA polymerase-3 subunit chi
LAALRRVSKHEAGSGPPPPSRRAHTNPHGAAIRFLIDGAPVPQDARAYERIVVLFDGEDPDALAAARACWSESKAKGFAVTYWQTDERGRWQRMG